MHKGVPSQSRGAPGAVAITYHCAQNEGTQTKQVQHKDETKRRARMTMERFPCKGELVITVNPAVNDAVRVRVRHQRTR